MGWLKTYSKGMTGVKFQTPRIRYDLLSRNSAKDAAKLPRKVRANMIDRLRECTSQIEANEVVKAFLEETPLPEKKKVSCKVAPSWER